MGLVKEELLLALVWYHEEGVRRIGHGDRFQLYILDLVVCLVVGDHVGQA